MSESSASSRIKRLVNTYSGLVLMGTVGIPVGVIVGAICALFGRVLLAIGTFRDEHITLLLPLLALAGLAIVFAYRTWSKGTDRGMSLVFDVGHGREDAISPRLVPLVMLSTWGTHLFGGSAGREGVAVQIGATVSHWIGQRLPFQDPGNTFLLIGMAAGFAGLFRTPLAATVFAIEVLVAGRMEYRALFPALTASLAASMTSGALGLEKFEVAVVASYALDPPLVLDGLRCWALRLAWRAAPLPGALHMPRPLQRGCSPTPMCASLLWASRYRRSCSRCGRDDTADLAPT